MVVRMAMVELMKRKPLNSNSTLWRALNPGAILERVKAIISIASRIVTTTMLHWLDCWIERIHSAVSKIRGSWVPRATPAARLRTSSVMIT